MSEPDTAEKKHWVFRARVYDRTGALTSIASAFSNEGVSIDTVVGHGFEERAGVDGSVVLTFWCTEAKIAEVMMIATQGCSRYERIIVWNRPRNSISSSNGATTTARKTIKTRRGIAVDSLINCNS